MGLHKTLPATIASLAKWSIDTKVSKTTTSNFPWPHNLSADLSYDELQIKQRCLWGLQIPQLTPSYTCSIPNTHEESLYTSSGYCCGWSRSWSKLTDWLIDLSMALSCLMACYSFVLVLEWLLTVGMPSNWLCLKESYDPCGNWNNWVCFLLEVLLAFTQN